MAEFDSLKRPRNPLVIGGVVVLAVGGLVGLAFLVSSLMASGRGDLDLAWLPPDSELIARVEVAELWKAPLLEPVRNNPLVGMFVGMAAGQYGLGLEDIESVTVGVAGISNAAGEARVRGTQVMFMTVPAVDGVIVVRTGKAISIDKVTAGAPKAEHAGTEYYRFDEDSVPAPLAVFFPDARTAVLGPESSIKAAIGRGRDVPDRPELAFADLDHHLVVVMVPKDPGVLARAAQQQAADDTAEAALPEDLAEKLRGLSFGLTLTAGAEFELRADCVDAESAERVQAELEKSVDQGRQAFGLVLAGAEPQYREALALIDRMLQQAAVTRSGTTVELTAALPRETKDVIARLAEGSLNPFALSGGDSGLGGFDMPGEIPVAPEAVSLEEFNESWQIDRDVQDQPAGEVLTSLANDLSLELKSGSDVSQALAKRVTLKLEDASRFSALETVCAAVGVHPVYPDQGGGGIELRPGPRSSPIAFAGPFVVEVESFEVFPQYAAGHLKLRVLTAGLPPSLMRALRKNERDIFRLESVTGPSGQDLVNRDEGIGTFLSGLDRTDVYVRSEAINLKDLLREVDTLTSARGRVQLSLPTGTQRVRLTSLAAGAAASAGDLKVRVAGATLAEDSSTLDFSFQGAGYADVVFVPLDAAGKALPVTGSYGGGSDTDGQTNVTVKGRPASVEATAVTARTELEYEFELKDIPVPQAAERPERLAPLEFAGHAAPVTIESKALSRENNQTRVTLRATNHSNKDIRRLELRLDYLDAAGKKIDDWPATYTGQSSFGDDTPPLAVASGRPAEFEVMAFLMPPEATQVQAVLRRIVCADGTVWAAPEE